MCTEKQPPGGYPIAVKYVISYIRSYYSCVHLAIVFKFVISKILLKPQKLMKIA